MVAMWVGAGRALAFYAYGRVVLRRGGRVCFACRLICVHLALSSDVLRVCIDVHDV